jgi:hypothetical protein
MVHQVAIGPEATSPPSRARAKQCSLIVELPAGRAEVPLFQGSVAAE